MSLLDWINEHDCGVYPTAVMNEDGKSITIRIQWLNTSDQTTGHNEVVVSTLAEAREAMGY